MSSLQDVGHLCFSSFWGSRGGFSRFQGARGLTQPALLPFAVMMCCWHIFQIGLSPAPQTRKDSGGENCWGWGPGSISGIGWIKTDISLWDPGKEAKTTPCKCWKETFGELPQSSTATQAQCVRIPPNFCGITAAPSVLLRTSPSAPGADAASSP